MPNRKRNADALHRRKHLARTDVHVAQNGRACAQRDRIGHLFWCAVHQACDAAWTDARNGARHGAFAPDTACMGSDGPMTGAWFAARIAPTLKPGEVVILDNLPAYRSAAARQAVEASAPAQAGTASRHTGRRRRSTHA